MCMLSARCWCMLQQPYTVITSSSSTTIVDHSAALKVLYSRSYNAVEFAAARQNDVNSICCCIMGACAKLIPKESHIAVRQSYRTGCQPSLKKAARTILMMTDNHFSGGTKHRARARRTMRWSGRVFYIIFKQYTARCAPWNAPSRLYHLLITTRNTQLLLYTM